MRKSFFILFLFFFYCTSDEKIIVRGVGFKHYDGRLFEVKELIHVRRKTEWLTPSGKSIKKDFDRKKILIKNPRGEVVMKSLHPEDTYLFYSVENTMFWISMRQKVIFDSQIESPLFRENFFEISVISIDGDEKFKKLCTQKTAVFDYDNMELVIEGDPYTVVSFKEKTLEINEKKDRPSVLDEYKGFFKSIKKESGEASLVNRVIDGLLVRECIAFSDKYQIFLATKAEQIEIESYFLLVRNEYIEKVVKFTGSGLPRLTHTIKLKDGKLYMYESVPGPFLMSTELISL